MVTVTFDGRSVDPIRPCHVFKEGDPRVDDFSEILIPHRELKKVVRSLADAISEDYRGQVVQPVVLMSGAYPFYRDLNRYMRPGVFRAPILIRARSYEGESSRGNLKVYSHPKSPKNIADVRDCDVLVIDDVVDTARTLEHLRMLILTFNPERVRGVELLRKPDSCRKVDLHPDMAYRTGVSIEDKFVVGYGLDYNGKLRNLPHIGVLSQYGKERLDRESKNGSHKT